MIYWCHDNSYSSLPPPAPPAPRCILLYWVINLAVHRQAIPHLPTRCPQSVTWHILCLQTGILMPVSLNRQIFCCINPGGWQLKQHNVLKICQQFPGAKIVRWQPTLHQRFWQLCDLPASCLSFKSVSNHWGAAKWSWILWWGLTHHCWPNGHLTSTSCVHSFKMN